LSPLLFCGLHKLGAARTGDTQAIIFHLARILGQSFDLGHGPPKVVQPTAIGELLI